MNVREKDPSWPNHQPKVTVKRAPPVQPDEPSGRRDILPIPDVPHVGLTTYDAKDPDTSYPPIRDVRPPEGAPNVLVILIDDVGFRRQQRLRRAVPYPELREAGRGRVEVHAVSHHGAVLADAAGIADRPQPSFGGHGRHHRDRNRCSRLQLGAAEHQSPAGADSEAQRILHGTVRQMPRGSGLADQPGGAVHCMADRTAAGSSISTASSAGRTTSGTRLCMRAPLRSSRRRRRTRAIT